MKYVIDTITPTNGIDYVYVQFINDAGKIIEKHCLPYDEKFETEIKARLTKCDMANTTLETKKEAIEAILAKAGATKAIEGVKI
jgi:hypothetical protein